MTRGQPPNVASNCLPFLFLSFPPFTFPSQIPPPIPVSENPVSFSLYRISPLSLSLMAETSYLSFSPFPCVPSISRSREPSSSLPAFTPSPKSSVFRPRPSRLLRFAAKASDSGNSFAEESFGFFPWNDGDSGKSMHIFDFFFFFFFFYNYTAAE